MYFLYKNWKKIINLADFRDLLSKSLRCVIKCCQRQLFRFFRISPSTDIHPNTRRIIQGFITFAAVLYLCRSLVTFWTKWWYRSKHPSFSEKTKTWIGGWNNIRNFVIKHSSEILTLNKKIRKRYDLLHRNNTYKGKAQLLMCPSPTKITENLPEAPSCF